MKFSLRNIIQGGPTEPDGRWDVQRTAPILIKVRERPATDVKEVWAEGDLAAAPIDIQNALCDVDRFTGYMPYLAEARYLGEPDPDGARYSYSRLELPVLSPRDFVHKVYVDRDAATDPAGVFANHWFSVPTRIPERPSVLRLQISEGSWLVTPLPGGAASHVIYCFCADPRGSIPSFAANRANVTGVTETFKNVEREAQRRGRERRGAQAGRGGPSS
jgi:hypothetical protein